MGLFDRLARRHAQRKGNRFIKSFKGKNELEIKKLFLDSKEYYNNETVLSYLFFNYTSIISVLPLKYQKSMIKSNLSMFKYASDEAKKSLVSDWLKDNKFIINSRTLSLNKEEYESYICMYFRQPGDISKLYMEDLTQVLSILIKYNVKETEKIVESIKDKLTDRQWDFILKVDKSFIKYANQNIQDKYSEDEEYAMYINGPARDKYINSQIKKINEDPSILASLPLDIQKEYIYKYPYMLNYIDEEITSELLKYDESLVKYLNVAALKKSDCLYDLLESTILKGKDKIIDIFVNKSLLNAKGKLFRYDKTSNNFSYQYNKRIIKIIQSLSMEQIISLIDIDVNYILPYIAPLYDENDSDEQKKDSVLEANSRCLNVFKKYYNDSIYSKYYKTINKIYSEYIKNIESYDYATDYNSIFEIFKLLFNKRIIQNNSSDKLSIYVGIVLIYKGKETEDSKKSSFALFKSFIKNAYNKDVSEDLYSYNSLELFDDRLSFVSDEILEEYQKYNYLNISTLLYITKSEDLDIFKYYYKIITSVHDNNRNILFRSLEYFSYYKDIIKDIQNKELTDEEMDNLIDLISSFNNNLNIKKKDELENYELNLLKRLVSDLSESKDETIYKNLFCKYFFGKTYSIKGSTGWLDIESLEQICDICEPQLLSQIQENGENKYDSNEISFYSMLHMLLTSNSMELLFSYIDKFLENKFTRNILPVLSLFEKMDKDKINIINAQVVTVNDIEELFKNNPGAVEKREEKGVIIYKFNNQDFRLLTSYSNNGIHYECKYLSQITKNCYGYDGINKPCSMRFATYEGNTIIKMHKDDMSDKLKPSFIIITGFITDDIFNIASSNGLRIIEAKEE